MVGLPLRVCGKEMPLPGVRAMTVDACEAYWEALARTGLRYAYSKHHRAAVVEPPYGALIEVSEGLRDLLVDAIRTIEMCLWRAVRRAGGLTAWFGDRAPTFEGVALNTPAINAQVERTYFGPGGPGRARMPLILDLILTAQAGHATLRVVELQTGLGYAKIVQDQLCCLGEDPEASSSWGGDCLPSTVLAAARRTLGDGGDISVLATFPSTTGNLPDEAGLARSLSTDGTARRWFLATELRRDADGWYHRTYELDEVTGLPRLDGCDVPLGPSGAPQRIERVVAMQTQRELDELGDRLSAAQRDRLREFLMDARSVHWVLPPAAWYILDKSSMPWVHDELRAAGCQYAELFVPTYGAGRIVDQAGRYVVKPIRGVGGHGVYYVDVAHDAAWTVPAGCIAQARFDLFPLPVRLPGPLAGAFPLPEGAPGSAELGGDPTRTTGTLELRIMTVPGSCEGADSYLLVARLAPSWDPLATRAGEPVLTNLKQIAAAIWNSPVVTAATWRLSPFGWCVVAARRAAHRVQ